MSDILCYKLRKKKNKKVNPQQSPQSPTSPPPCHPVIPKPRYGSEKVANFKAPQSQTSISSPKSSVLMPPLSPGRVCVLKNVSRTASTVSSVYQYTVSSSSMSPSPTTQPSTATNSNSPNLNPTSLSNGTSKPPSRNSAYSPPSSPVGQNRKQSENSKTYLDQLEEENKQLKNLLLKQNMASNLPHGEQGEGENLCLPNTREILDKNVKIDHLQSSEVCQKLKSNSARKQVTNINVKKPVAVNSDMGIDINPYSVPDLIQNIPGQLSPNTITKSPNTHLLYSKPAKLVQKETIVRHKKPSYLFVGSNGEVLAESKGTSECSEIIYKRVSASIDKTKDDKTPAWEKLKQISSNLEQSLGCHACKEVPRYPCQQDMYFKSDLTKD